MEMRCLGWAAMCLALAQAFCPGQQRTFVSTRTTSATTELYMVLDFFQKRTEEGVSQLNNIADAAYRGELGRGLSQAAAYTANTNQAFASGLAKSRTQLLKNLEALFSGLDPEDVLEELEDILLQADIGSATAEEIIQEVDSLRLDSSEFLSKDDLLSVMRGKLLEALETEGSRAVQFSTIESIPTVLFVMGANGMGKTTTIGKLANRLRTEGNQTVLLAACDTFRAGAVEQLQGWAERAQVDMIGPSEQAKTPSAVLYSALDHALAGNYDAVLVDTSGRLSNNDALTQELAKMKRVIQKRMSVDDGQLNANVPHETLLVLDAAQGRMALDSAKVWNEEIGLSGLILTKLDGSARGGSIVAVTRDLGLPIKLLGVGEGIDDLRDFEPELFVDGLLGIGEAGGKAASKATIGEGAMLAARLDEMRQERDARATTVKKKVAVPVGAGAGDFGDLQPITANAAAAGAPRKPNRRKKGKKKKGRR